MKLHIAIPVMDEMEWLPLTLESLANQSLKDFKLWICVNQPDSWWDLDDKRGICASNAQVLRWLSSYSKVNCQIIDRSSRGRGWKDRKGGVGAARRVAMNAISANADPQDIIVSLDSDTRMDSDYLAQLRRSFVDNPDAAGYTSRYYHCLTGDQEIDRAVLRYEIYMRHYLISLMSIESPYAFTALGSALATTVRSYRRVGGMTPKKSAEDFYFLVKLAKFGRLIYGERARVYPASRVSERVVFGTGQAVYNGFAIMKERYPIFERELFDDIAATTSKFPELFDNDIELPLSAFLRENLSCDNLWAGLRKNHTSRERFVRACHERVDGLRLFQYLRAKKNPAISDETTLFKTLNTVLATQFDSLVTPAVRDILARDLKAWSFESAPIDELDELRNLLVAIEDAERVRRNNIEHRTSNIELRTSNER